MTKVVLNRAFPIIDRDSFLTPFDRMFDQIVESLVASGAQVPSPG